MHRGLSAQSHSLYKSSSHPALISRPNSRPYTTPTKSRKFISHRTQLRKCSSQNTLNWKRSRPRTTPFGSRQKEHTFRTPLRKCSSQNTLNWKRSRPRTTPVGSRHKANTIRNGELGNTYKLHHLPASDLGKRTRKPRLLRASSAGFVQPPRDTRMINSMVYQSSDQIEKLERRFRDFECIQKSFPRRSRQKSTVTERRPFSAGGTLYQKPPRPLKKYMPSLKEPGSQFFRNVVSTSTVDLEKVRDKKHVEKVRAYKTKRSMDRALQRDKARRVGRLYEDTRKRVRSALQRVRMAYRFTAVMKKKYTDNIPESLLERDDFQNMYNKPLSFHCEQTMQKDSVQRTEYQMAQLERWLKHVLYLRRQPPSVATALRSVVRMKSFDRNDVVYSKGDIVRGMYIVRRGQVKVEAKKGFLTETRIFREGEAFGLPADA
eukprot:978028_1